MTINRVIAILRRPSRASLQQQQEARNLAADILEKRIREQQHRIIKRNIIR